MRSLKFPVVTEKSIAQAEKRVYTFAVELKMTKPEIAKLIEKLYSVNVMAVRVQKVIGQKVRRKTGVGKKPDWKKARVTIQTGQTIQDFAFPPEEKESKESEKKQ